MALKLLYLSRQIHIQQQSIKISIFEILTKSKNDFFLFQGKCQKDQTRTIYFFYNNIHKERVVSFKTLPLFNASNF